MSSSAPSVTDAWMLLYLDVTAVERHRHAQELLRAFEEHGRSEAIPALTQLWGQPSWPDELRHCASAALAGIIGRTPVQALPRVDEALRAYTSANAYGVYAENSRGILKPGYQADIVLLDRDLTTVRPDQIDQAVVRATVVDGKVVYERGE